MSAVQGAVEGVKSYWINLTDRERVLIGVMLAVLSGIAILLPVYLLGASIGDLQAENREISAALRTIGHSQERLALQRAARQAAEARYAQRAPSLGSYLEGKAQDYEDLSIADVQHEPERELGRYRVRHTRARFQGAGLRSTIELLTSVKNSRYPLAIERIHLDHNQSGDRYNIQIGLLAYDREGSGVDGGVPSPPPADRAGRAGPPAP